VTAHQGQGAVLAVLLGLHVKLGWRRLGKASLVLSAITLLASVAVAVLICVLAWPAAHHMAAKDLRRLASYGGSTAVFATLLGYALLARVWFALVAVGQPSSLFDPRRFRIYPISDRLLSAVNFAAIFVEPAWLIIYPMLAAFAVSVSWLPGAPAAPLLWFAELLAVFATGGVLHLAAAIGAAFEARPLLRRGFSVLLVIASFVALPLRMQLAPQTSLPFFAASGFIAWTPAGWAARLAGDLSSGRVLHALLPLSLLLVLGLVFSIAAHAISSRDQLRPAEVAQAGRASAHAAGWRLPLLPGAFSALFEKEAKTALRVGWLQLLLLPVAYLFLVSSAFKGPQPLLVAAVYANVGVLEFATNAFGRDADGARAWFLWPLSLRLVLAAKNAVAYCFSLLIFCLMASAAMIRSPATVSQLLIGLLAHAAIFPLLVGLGNAVSVISPMPVRGGQLRRVRGTGRIVVRLMTLGVLAAAAWTPYALSRATGLRLGIAYAGEFVAMAVAYLGTLTAGAHFVETRREPLLAALRKED
jgi:hypothetical protein